MIKSFHISEPKDENGFYILPYDITHRAVVLNSLGYHNERMKSVKNIMFAIICVTYQNKNTDITVNGWTEKYVRINGDRLYYERFFLDEEENKLYETENDNELVVVKRQLKLKKLNI